MVTVRVPATTANLGPGFDTLGMALDLFNYVEVREINDGLIIEIEGEGSEIIPKDTSNIVYKAVVSTLQKCSYEPKGLYIKLRNFIPVARGMGSSAAALVGGVYAANILAGSPLSDDEIFEIATSFEGHPDNVAPALFGGLVVSVMQKDQLTYRQVSPPDDLFAIVAIPDFQLTTKRARQVLPKEVPIKDAIFNIGHSALLILSFINKDYELLAHAMQDKLHQPYRMQLIPGVKDVLDSALDAGALGVAISGAGPTLIAFAQNLTEEIGQAMQQKFLSNGISCSIKILKPNSFGTEVVGKEMEDGISGDCCTEIWR